MRQAPLFRRGFARVVPAIIVVAAGTTGAGGCGPEVFATVKLQVREPAGKTRRAENINTVADLLEGEEGPPRMRSFEPGEPVVSKPILLGRDEDQTLLATLFLGNPNEPVALGSPAPILIPKIQDPPKDITLNAPLVLAAPNVVELLDDQRPTARQSAALCMDAATGKGWFIGGFEGGQGLKNGYAFSPEDLLAKETVLTDLQPGQMACDADAFGRFVLVESRCSKDGVAGANGTLSIGAEGQDETAVIPTGCRPSVSVAGANIWVATDRNIAVYALETLENRASVVTIDAVGPMIALAKDKALVLNAGASTLLAKLVDDQLTIGPGPDIDEGIAFARSGEDVFVLTAGGIVGSVDETQGLRDARAVVSAENGVPRGLAMLPDGRAVVLTDVAVVVEGSAPTPHGGREALGVTVGGAVVLIGGSEAGTDVLVPEATN